MIVYIKRYYNQFFYVDNPLWIVSFYDHLKFIFLNFQQLLILYNIVRWRNTHKIVASIDASVFLVFSSSPTATDPMWWERERWTEWKWGRQTHTKCKKREAESENVQERERQTKCKGEREGEGVWGRGEKEWEWNFLLSSLFLWLQEHDCDWSISWV